MTLKWCFQGREKGILRAINHDADPWLAPKCLLMVLFPDKKNILFSGNKIYNQCLSASPKIAIVLHNFFSFFLPFYVFSYKKLKSIFWPALWRAQHPNAGQNIKQSFLAHWSSTNSNFQQNTYFNQKLFNFLVLFEEFSYTHRYLI